jgi:hypothetical protein
MTFVVDRNGNFAAEPARSSDFAAALEAALKKPASAFANGEKPARLTIKFTLDDEAEGIPGTTITLKALDASGAAVREETMQTSGQASQVVWRYPSLADGGGEIRVAVEAEGCPKQEAIVSSPDGDSQLTFKFTSPRSIAGRVVAGDGTVPVAGAMVTVYRNDGGTRRTATTDAEGQFKVPVFPGTYFLSFQGTDDFAPVNMQREEIDVDADADPPPVNVEACSAITVTGTVKDQDGKPVAGAQVRGVANAKMVVTDAAGHFELGGVASLGQTAIVASKPPLVAQVVLSDVNPEKPIDLTLQPQNIDRVSATGLSGKMPRLELHNVVHDEPVDWQPAPDSDTLIAFCSLWHPAGRELAQRAQKWADDHDVHVTIVSTDWSIGEARRRWETLGLNPPGIRSPLYAGAGGIEIAKDWKLNSPAQAYLVSPQGNVLKALDLEKMQ